LRAAAFRGVAFRAAFFADFLAGRADFFAPFRAVFFAAFRAVFFAAFQPVFFAAFPAAVRPDRFGFFRVVFFLATILDLLAAARRRPVSIIQSRS
jgi:hypothetical protein